MAHYSSTPFKSKKRSRAMTAFRNQDKLATMPPHGTGRRWSDIEASQSTLMKAKGAGLITSRRTERGEKGRLWQVTEAAEQYLDEKCGVKLTVDSLQPISDRPGTSVIERDGDGDEDWTLNTDAEFGDG